MARLCSARRWPALRLLPIRRCRPGFGLLCLALLCIFAGAASGADQAPPSFDKFLAGVQAANSDDGSVPFSSAAFAQAQDANALIVVHINAFWCSTCGVQRNALTDILAQLKKTPAFADLVVFAVDFDGQKDLVKRFGVQSQGTLIVYRGHNEVGRSLGDTDEASITALLTRAENASAAFGKGAAPVLSIGSYALAVLAGLLSALSPCVLPLLPIVMSGAAAAHRFGPLALVGGFAISFVVIGMFVGEVGFGIGLDQETIRVLAASLMILFGIVLLSAFLQERLVFVEGRFQSVSDRFLRWAAPSGLRGQFLVGALLGGVWSPCIGPTLGAAITLAGERQAQTMAQVALVMLLFCVGLGIPLIAIGMVSHQAILRWRQQIEIAEHVAKSAFGAIMVVIGGAILLGADRGFEAFLIRLSPDWWTKISTLY